MAALPLPMNLAIARQSRFGGRSSGIQGALSMDDVYRTCRFVKTISHLFFHKMICDKQIWRPSVCESQNAPTLFTTDFVEDGIVAGELVKLKKVGTGGRGPRRTGGSSCPMREPSLSARAGSCENSSATP